MSKRSKKAKQVRKALRQARALITPIAHWTQQTEARDSSGGVTSFHAADAAKFCAVGSVHYILWQSPDFADLDEQERHSLYRDVVRVLDECARSEGYTVNNIVNLNDSGIRGDAKPSLTETRKARHARVLKAFDCAVEKADTFYPEAPPVAMRPEAGSVGLTSTVS